MQCLEEAVGVDYAFACVCVCLFDTFDACANPLTGSRLSSFCKFSGNWFLHLKLKIDKEKKGKREMKIDVSNEFG